MEAKIALIYAPLPSTAYGGAARRLAAPGGACGAAFLPFTNTENSPIFDCPAKQRTRPSC